MSEFITIPKIEETVEWHNQDLTVIIGYNGTGKTLLMHGMMDWCDSKGYDYAHYDAITALREFDDILENAEDEDIIYACMTLGQFVVDFQDNLDMWSVAEDGKPLEELQDYKNKIHVIKRALKADGNGFKRMFVMMVKALQNPEATYYFLDLPETSIHIMVLRELTQYLMCHIPHMKFVIATHSPELLWDIKTEDQEQCVIDLPTAYKNT